MSNEPKNFTSPVGRLIGGSVFKPKALTDKAGKPLLDDQGKPVTDISFGVAFPKVGPYAPGTGQTIATTHWSQVNLPDQSKPFGSVIWATGNAAHPVAVQRPDFSWKITDGDSTVPNKKGRKPCDQEGYPGHWIVWFSSRFAPATWNATASARVEPEAIKLGHYIQVAGSVRGNTGDSPGVYLNHNLVAHAGYGPEISTGMDVSEAGFGVGAVLPAGASTTPVAALPSTSPPGAAVVTQQSPPPPVTTVQPHPGFTNGAGVDSTQPPAPVMPDAPPPPPPAGPQMTAKAGAFTFESFIAKGWTEANLRAQGYIV